MPLVKVNMIKGKSLEYKKTVLDCIHVGLMESLGIEDWDRFQRIVEIPKEDFDTAPEKTDNFMIIELTLFPGRTKEQKGDAIKAITSRLGNENAHIKWLTPKRRRYRSSHKSTPDAITGRIQAL